MILADFGAEVIVIDGPQGRVFETRAEIDRARAQLFRAGGRRAPAGGWAPGLYSGRVELLREGEAISRRRTQTRRQRAPRDA